MPEPPTEAHEIWEELAAGYALHALEAADADRFEAHLASCGRCQSMLDDFSLVAAQLGTLAETRPDDPPSWGSIRAAIVGGGAVVEPIERRRRLAARTLAAAAGVIVLAGAGVLAWQVTRGGNTTRPEQVAALSACEHRTGCRLIRLHTSSGTNPAAVTIDHGEVTVVPLSMANAPAGRAYALWQLPRDGGPMLVTEFQDISRKPDATPLLSGYADTAAFAISMEPAGAMPSHPSDVLAIGATT